MTAYGTYNWYSWVSFFVYLRLCIRSGFFGEFILSPSAIFLRNKFSVSNLFITLCTNSLFVAVGPFRKRFQFPVLFSCLSHSSTQSFTSSITTAPLLSGLVIMISSLTFTSSSGFCSFSERLEHFGCFSFLIVASISLFVAFINVSTGWCFLEESRYLLDGFLNIPSSVKW